MNNEEITNKYRYDVVEDLVSHSKHLCIKNFEVRDTLTPDCKGMETEFMCLQLPGTSRTVANPSMSQIHLSSSQFYKS